MIRAAQPSDASAIAAIWNEMIRTSLATFTTLEKSTAEVEEMIQTRPKAFWVSEDSQINGFATFGPFRAGPGYGATLEHTVILADPARGKGLGRALMAQVETAARLERAHVLVAGISSANPGAMGFHAQLGFIETARMPQVGRKDGQWLDLIFMQKTISTP